MKPLTLILLETALSSEPALYQRVREDNRRAEVHALDRYAVRPENKRRKVVDKRSETRLEQ